MGMRRVVDWGPEVLLLMRISRREGHLLLLLNLILSAMAQIYFLSFQFLNITKQKEIQTYNSFRPNGLNATQLIFVGTSHVHNYQIDYPINQPYKNVHILAAIQAEDAIR